MKLAYPEAGIRQRQLSPQSRRTTTTCPFSHDQPTPQAGGEGIRSSASTRSCHGACAPTTALTKGCPQTRYVRLRQWPGNGYPLRLPRSNQGAHFPRTVTCAFKHPVQRTRSPNLQLPERLEQQAVSQDRLTLASHSEAQRTLRTQTMPTDRIFPRVWCTPPCLYCGCLTHIMLAPCQNRGNFS